MPGPRTCLVLELAHEALKLGRKLISEWQKPIQKADHLDLGWSVVAEYMANKPADILDNGKGSEKA